jgi:hypothetical protein
VSQPHEIPKDPGFLESHGVLCGEWQVASDMSRGYTRHPPLATRRRMEVRVKSGKFAGNLNDK